MPSTARFRRDLGRKARVKLTVPRRLKPHVTIKYPESEFIDLIRKGLRGLAPDSSRDTGFSRSDCRDQRDPAIDRVRGERA